MFFAEFKSTDLSKKFLKLTDHGIQFCEFFFSKFGEFRRYFPSLSISYVKKQMRIQVKVCTYSFIKLYWKKWIISNFSHFNFQLMKVNKIVSEYVEYLWVGMYFVHLFYLFIWRCSMALLHSRIRRLFFESPNKISGGLSGVFSLHTDEGLNHHFEVYRVSFDKEALGVSDSWYLNRTNFWADKCLSVLRLFLSNLQN